MKTYFFRSKLHILVVLGASLMLGCVALYLNEVDFSSVTAWTLTDRAVQTTTDSSLHKMLAPHSTDLTPEDRKCTVLRKDYFEKANPDTTSTLDNCNGCSKFINQVLEKYSLNWTRNEENHQKLRYLLIENCNGFQKAIVTQTNSPLGTTIVYDAEMRNRRVTEDLLKNFPKDVPFSNKVLNTCAVVGNGGILVNSSCGDTIDSAQFVIRCNLPRVDNGYSKHVGKKTSLVTANPSMLIKRYQSLVARRRAFVDDVQVYGDSLLFLPAFSFAFGTDISFKAHYTLEDFQSSVKAVFMNPDYLRSLGKFWRSQHLQFGGRLSSGFMMISLALEICNNVDVFGFWPFYNHPYGFQPLKNHYYDDVRPGSLHRMPNEFAHLIKLHNQGVLRLHLGQCCPQ